MNKKAWIKKDWLMMAINALIALLLAVVSLRFPNDPDMGWHIRNGQDILQGGFPAGDTYSWTMPGYPWVSHEWLSDVLMYLIHNAFGLWGLVLLFAIVIGTLFYFAAGLYRTTFFLRVLLALMGILVSWSVVGVRPQMFTLLGFASVLYILFDYRRNPSSKLIFLLPVIFALWANLHGGFSIGLVVLVLFGLSELWRNILLGRKKVKLSHPLMHQKQGVTLVWIGLLSATATLINPSGWKVYLELVQTFADRTILNSIAEWLGVSLFYRASYNLALLALLTFILLVVNRFRRLDITKFILAVTILIFATTSWRHLPLFAIAVMPLLAEQLEMLTAGYVETAVRSWLTPVLLFLLSGAILYHYLIVAVPAFSDMNTFGRTFNFPEGPIEYLRENPPGENLLNEYNWGGYLIWQYPERKVFIDGRMAIWKWKGIEMFREYKTLLGSDKQASLDGLKRWEIDTILTTATHPIGLFLQGQEGWKQAYRDEQYMIWEKRTS